jgi:hypothetical protein
MLDTITHKITEHLERLEKLQIKKAEVIDALSHRTWKSVRAILREITEKDWQRDDLSRNRSDYFYPPL